MTVKTVDSTGDATRATAGATGCRARARRGTARRAWTGGALATIVYTSGTTGQPKGVMLSHQNMLQNVKSASAATTSITDDVFLSFLPLSHMFERTVGYYLTMVAGAQVAFARSIPQLAEDFRTVRPTVIVSVPRIFERLHAAIQGQLAGGLGREAPAVRVRAPHRMEPLRMAPGARAVEARASCSGRLLKALVAARLLERLGGRLRLASAAARRSTRRSRTTFIGLGLPICQGYGLTEASPVVSVNRLEKNDPASIGAVLPGVEVAFGENGVLLVSGPNVMMGYWNNPEATARVLNADGWLDTGDQARLEDGLLYITGRIKEIIVMANGEKVPPVDMELAIQLDPLLEQVLVVGEGKPYLGALVALDMDEWARFAQARDCPPIPRGRARARGEARARAHRTPGARLSRVRAGAPRGAPHGQVDGGQRAAHADAQAEAQPDPRALPRPRSPTSTAGHGAGVEFKRPFETSSHDHRLPAGRTARPSHHSHAGGYQRARHDLRRLGDGAGRPRGQRARPTSGPRGPS